jgi:hypothetical protein
VQKARNRGPRDYRPRDPPRTMVGKKENMGTFYAYQEAVIRTMPTTLSYDMALACYALGLVGEVGELAELVSGRGGMRAELVEEVGDVLWYAAAMRQTLGVTGDGGVGAYPEGNVSRTDVCIAAARVSEAVKKRLLHGVDADIDGPLHDVINAVMAFADAYEVSFVEAAVANTAKLLARYPDGFVPGGGVR